MNTFEEAFKVLMELEGGYVNDKDDPGGETKFGISKTEYPEIDIKNLTLDQAKQIYFNDYWLRAHCPDLENYSRKLAKIHFITAVNIGIRRANRILQKALNIQGFNLVVDGIIGDATLSALHKCTIPVLIRDYILELISYYTDTANRRVTMRKFFRGWINRALRLRKV